MTDGQIFLETVKVVAALIAVIVLAAGGCDAYKTRVYVEHGYTSKVLPGHQGAEWVKE